MEQRQTDTTNPGTFGFVWHEVEPRAGSTGSTDGATSVSWYVDGPLIGRLEADVGDPFSTDGQVTIGYMDPLSPVSDNRALSFGLIDNLRVVPEADPCHNPASPGNTGRIP